MNSQQLATFKLNIIPAISCVASFFIDTRGFIISLIVALAFNIWAGMRADGVSIIRCKNFKMSKFTDAVFQFLLYLVVLESLFAIFKFMGDVKLGIYTAKLITYIFLYTYVQNGCKNLCIAYPRNKALRIIYYVVRFEFMKATPSYVQELIDRIEREDKEKGNTK